jgi:hypothetical protein
MNEKNDSNSRADAFLVGRQPPLRPKQEECCERGCEPCIFDYYENVLQRWLAQNPSEKAKFPDLLRE